MPRAAACPFDPPPGLRSLQADAPIAKVRLWDGTTPWLVTRHAEQRTLLADPRISADPRRPGYPHVSVGARDRRRRTVSLITMDNPEHARLRRMVNAPFAGKHIEPMRPAIQRIFDDLIDQMLAGPKPVDLVQALALPGPSLVICELLGVPYADHDFFQRNSRIVINRDTSPDEMRQAGDRLTDYLDRLIARKLAEPADDLLSRLAVEQVTSGELTRDDLTRLGVLLLVAGHETTANMIGLGTLALLLHPDQLAGVRDADDPRVIAGAVEELLRYLSIVHSGRRRVALADIEIDGQVIRAGEGVIIATDLANREEDVFADPDRLNIHRDAHRHMAFGFGVHQCLGQQLARTELQVVYGTLYRRIPTLRLAVEVDQVPFKHDGLVYGVYELPVTW
jgi:cytochrome P450